MRGEEHWLLGHGEWLKRIVLVHEVLIRHIEHALIELRGLTTGNKSAEIPETEMWFTYSKVRFIRLLREGRRHVSLNRQEVEMRRTLFRVTWMG